VAIGFQRELETAFFMENDFNKSWTITLIYLNPGAMLTCRVAAARKQSL
jgi:hypothetical protein